MRHAFLITLVCLCAAALLLALVPGRPALAHQDARGAASAGPVDLVRDRAQSPHAPRIEAPAPPRAEAAARSEPEAAVAAARLAPHMVVTTIDAADRPVPGIPVGISMLLYGRSGTVVRPAGVTDDAGELRLRPREHGRLVVDIPGAPASAGVELSELPRPAPGAPVAVALRVPPFAPLHVLVLGAAGLPVGDANVQVSVAQTANHGDANLGFRLENEPQVFGANTGADGRAVFPAVALGQRFLVRAKSRGRVIEQTIAGPDFAGRSTQAVLTFTNQPTTLVATLVDATQRPLAERDLRMTLADGDFSLRLASDAQGQVRVDLPDTIHGQPARLRFELLDANHHLTGATATLQLDDPRPGLTPLGTISLCN